MHSFVFPQISCHMFGAITAVFAGLLPSFNNDHVHVSASRGHYGQAWNNGGKNHCQVSIIIYYYNSSTFLNKRDSELVQYDKHIFNAKYTQYVIVMLHITRSNLLNTTT